ncbi:hypothetical protein REPUB_Repub01dG0235800 [Reevesia pubescens]
MSGVGGDQGFNHNEIPRLQNNFGTNGSSANSVANLVLSTLLQGNIKLKVRSDLVVFWTPFILWHLGSPHNITAYSLEDNEMWLRQFFGLVIQIGEAVYIQIKFRSTSTLISFLAFPIFIAGVFKAGERVWALRCASRKEIINSLSLDFEKQKDESSTRKGKLGSYAGAGSEVRIVSQAYGSFNTFKPLYIDLPVLIKKKEFYQVINLKYESENEGSAEKAFTLVGIELSFLYDLLFTKIPIHQHGIKVSFSLHGLCFLCAVSSLIGFSVFVDKKKIKGIDIAISYMLVVGAISLDIFLFIKHAFSKWTIAKFGSVHCNNKLYSRLLTRKLRSIKSKEAIKKVAQHDLISYFVEAIERNFVGAIRLIDTGNLLQKYKYTTWELVDPSLTTFIYDQLLKKCDEYHQLKQRHQEKNSHLLILSNLLDKDPYDDVFLEKGVNLKDDKDWTPDTTDFSRCIFVWHIATNLVYYRDHYDHQRGMVGSYCQISKTLSDYMLYLVLLRPMMLPKGYGEVINEVTYKSAKIFFPKKMRDKFTDNKKQFVIGLLDSPDLIPREKGERNMEVLEEGRLLGNKLQDLVREESVRLDPEEKWEIISKVWMGMMMKAASRCSWKEHAQQLRHGGELLTHVSLLMAHLGLSTQILFPPQEDESCQFPTPDF